ncbi:hypothetical protein CW304_02340 [Bacillus sp. UFRGS-B20]|nr:hypothetical protein CW304_02340 [Bacillus sp. UFRGS-B20]
MRGQDFETLRTFGFMSPTSSSAHPATYKSFKNGGVEGFDRPRLTLAACPFFKIRYFSRTLGIHPMKEK